MANNTKNNNPVPAENPIEPMSADAKLNALLDKLNKQVEDNAAMMARQQEEHEAKMREMDEKIKAAGDTVAQITKKPSAEVLAKVEEVHKSKAQLMKEHLSKQPLIRMFIPLTGSEKIGSVEPVIMNGFRLNVPKGVYVDVPQQVADELRERFQQEEQAGRNFRLDLPREKKDGINPLDALS